MNFGSFLLIFLSGKLKSDSHVTHTHTRARERHAYTHTHTQRNTHTHTQRNTHRDIHTHKTQFSLWNILRIIYLKVSVLHVFVRARYISTCSSMCNNYIIMYIHVRVLYTSDDNIIITKVIIEINYDLL